MSNHFRPHPNKIVSPHRVKTQRPSAPPTQHTQHKKPVRPVNTPEPFKLSYGGWKPIGFSEDSARSKPKDVIVTIDSAIASAPEAESDDLLASADPAVPPPYEAPSPVYVTPKAKPAPAPAYDPSPMSALAIAPVPAAPVYSPVSAAPVYSPAPHSVILPSYTPAPDTISPASSNGGSPDSLLSYADSSIESNTRLTKDVTKDPNSDELFYLYYRDPEPKTEFTRDAGLSQHLGVRGLDFPLYDDEEIYDVYRTERDQDQGPFGVQSSSSVTFNQNIGGQQSGFSYTITG